MWVHILGSAAGGGFPQWNCNCPNCRGVRDGSLPCRRRTQSSIAVNADYQHWFLFNAAPEISCQINASSPLLPRGNARHTPIQGIVLSDAELDHTIGLLSLRETRRLRIHTTEWIYTALNQWNPILRTLNNYCAVEWVPMRLGESVPLFRADGMDSGLRCQAFATFSTKVVAYAAEPISHSEATVGYRITCPGYLIRSFLKALSEQLFWSRVFYNTRQAFASLLNSRQSYEVRGSKISFYSLSTSCSMKIFTARL